MRKIYLASSWRNPAQPMMVTKLRAAGHEVYDFRNPAPGNTGFAWSSIDPGWQSWETHRFITALEHPIACDGFRFDYEAMNWADTFVLLMPCGRSAHLELGWACGASKRTVVYLQRYWEFEPELMYKLADLVTDDFDKVLEFLA